MQGNIVWDYNYGTKDHINPKALAVAGDDTFGIAGYYRVIFCDTKGEVIEDLKYENKGSFYQINTIAASEESLNSSFFIIGEDKEKLWIQKVKLR